VTSPSGLSRRAIARFRRLPRRQALLLAGAVLLPAVALVGSVAGILAPSIGLLAALTVLNLVAVVQMVSVAQRHRAMRSIAEQMQRRVVAAVETERLAGAERHQSLVDEIHSAVNQLGRRIVSLQRAQLQETEALLQLFRNITPRAPMPSAGDYALNPTDLLELVFLLEQKQPTLVLELGSGTSTVWIGYVVQRYGGRLISVDQDREYAARTRSLVTAHRLDGVVEVREAPLCPITIDGVEFSWYQREAVEDLSDIDFVLIDGPTASAGAGARFPAMHVLEPRLADEAMIILDDANRPDEQEAVVKWASSVSGLARQPSILGRHAVLSYVRTAPALAKLPS